MQVLTTGTTIPLLEGSGAVTLIAASKHSLPDQHVTKGSELRGGSERPGCPIEIQITLTCNTELELQHTAASLAIVKSN